MTLVALWVTGGDVMGFIGGEGEYDGEIVYSYSCEGFLTCP